MFNGLLEGTLARALGTYAKEEEITEIRLRACRPLTYSTVGGKKTVRMDGGCPYIVSLSDVEGVLCRASDFSVYAVNDDLCKGYLTKRGVRIGVAGEGVVENAKLLTMKNINYLVLRIPHEIKGVADKVADKIICGDKIKNTLIVSPPCGGKTTLLRDLARVASARFSTLIIDERYELAACENGLPTLDVGDCEVVSGVVKVIAYENCVRAMSPQLIVTDEIFRAEEVAAIGDIIRGGVSVFASAHGSSKSALSSSTVFSKLVELFDVVITLGTNPVGAIIEVAENG